MIREQKYRGKLRYFLVSLLVFCVFPLSGQAVEIDPDLEEQIAAAETAGYVIHFRQQAILLQPPSGGWKEQREFVTKALRETANRSQARVLKYLFERRVPHRSLWKDNTIIVDRSDRDTFEGLKAFPEIEAIRAMSQPRTPSPQDGESLNKDTGPSGDQSGEYGKTVGRSETDAAKEENRNDR